MADYNLVNIGNIYLTDNGLVGGLPCRTEVAGLDSLYSAYSGATVIPISGKPYNFILENEGGSARIQIRPSVVEKEVLESVRAVLDAALAANSTVQCGFVGDTGTYDLNCKPVLPKSIEFSGEFSNGKIYESVINLIVDSVN